MGAVNPTTGTKTGEEYAPGMPYGSELIWSGSQAQATGTAQPWYGMVLNKTLTFNISAFDFNTDLSRALQLTIPYGAQVTNPDISKFKEGGGKLILWAGWNDQLWSEANIVSYYKQVAAKMNGAGVDAISKTQDFSRLFMAPGMGHCGGGDGPNVLDTFPPLVDWVERGKAPDKIVAAKNLNNQAAQGVEKTRPICPYPQVAKWTGAGNANLADNYRCVSP
jgi:feruloyl esterase